MAFAQEVRLFNHVHQVRAEVQESDRGPLLVIGVEGAVKGYGPDLLRSLQREVIAISAMSTPDQNPGLVVVAGSNPASGQIVLAPDNNVPKGRQAEFLNDVMGFMPESIEQARRNLHHDPGEPDTGVVLDEGPKPPRPKGPRRPGH